MCNLELGRHRHEHLRQVPERLDERLLVLARDDNGRRRLAPALQELDGLLRGRLRKGVAGDEAKRPGRRVIAQRRAQRSASGFLVHLQREVARHRREGDASAGELRRADRALAGATGALLAPRLRASAGDEATAFRCPRALAARVELGADGLVHEMRLDLVAEDGLVERDLLLRAAQQGCLQRSHYLMSSRISTRPFFGPGTAPLTRRRFRSASTEWTVSPTWVLRLPPIRPAIFTPLKTRDGVAEAPIEPGLRTLCEPCVTGPRLKVGRLIVPWQPLPMPVPETLTLSPG